MSTRTCPDWRGRPHGGARASLTSGRKHYMLSGLVGFDRPGLVSWVQPLGVHSDVSRYTCFTEQPLSIVKPADFESKDLPRLVWQWNRSFFLKCVMDNLSIQVHAWIKCSILKGSFFVRKGQRSQNVTGPLLNELSGKDNQRLLSRLFLLRQKCTSEYCCISWQSFLQHSTLMLVRVFRVSDASS